jgi:hypothetical protein
MPCRSCCTLLVACTAGWLALPGSSRGQTEEAVAKNRLEQDAAQRADGQAAVRRRPIADPAVPPYVIVLRSRNGAVVPERTRDGQTAGGHIDVIHTTPERVIFWMRGAVVAGAEQWKGGQAAMHFTLEQDFEVVPTRAGLRPPRLTLEGVLIGTLLSTLKAGGTATQGPALASVVSGDQTILGITLNPHEVHCNQRLFVNDRAGPFEQVVVPGNYHLSQKFDLAAVQPWNHCQHLGEGVSAIFDPTPRLEPRWSYLVVPFRAIPSREFGFAAVVRVVEAVPPAAAAPAPESEPTERLPPPRPEKPVRPKEPILPGNP